MPASPCCIDCVVLCSVGLGWVALRLYTLNFSAFTVQRNVAVVVGDGDDKQTQMLAVAGRQRIASR